MRSVIWITISALAVAAVILGNVSLPFASWVWLVVGTSIALQGTIGAAVLRGGRAALSSRTVAAILASGVLLRLLLFPAAPYLSDDAFRYHWDGKVQSHGINPYRHAPNDDALASIERDPIDAHINHPELVTVYPPLTQLVFATAYRLTPGSLTGFHALCLLAELAAWIIVIADVRRRGRSVPASLSLLALSPLLVFQGYLPGHTDVLALPLLAALVATVARGWSLRSGVLLGLACLIKPFALLFLPALLASLRGRRLVSLLALVATVGAAYVPFASAGENLSSSMLLMARKWSFNGSIADLLDGYVAESRLRWMLAIAMGLVAVAAARVGRSFAARCLIAFTGFVAFTPTLYPWYLTWSVPFLVARPSPSLILLASLLPLADVVAIDYYTIGVWSRPLWPALVMYLPFFILLGVEGVRRRGMFTRGDDIVEPDTLPRR